MKCIKCHKEMREGAKFCTSCGTKQATVMQQETVHSMPHGNNAPSAGNNSQLVTQVGESVHVTHNYLFWHIQPGEIARIINEAEFINYSSARGIIINQGTVARIYLQGQLIATLKGGKYDFVAQKEFDTALDRHFGGLLGGLDAIKRFFVNLMLGSSARERIEESNDTLLRNVSNVDQIVHYLNNGKLFSIVLLQDREFRLVFGDSHDNERAYNDFQPINVRTAHLDFRIGVSAIFKVCDPERLMRQYLTERNVLTTEYLAKVIAPYVEMVVQRQVQSFGNEPLDYMMMNSLLESRIPQIEAELRQIELDCIMLRNVQKVTCSNEDLERFRQVSRELYLSEEELNYLHKTNDFKNRLATAANQQRLHEARTDLELMRSLQEINKDRIISEDELERFYIILSRERRVFEAADAETEEKALDDIRRTGLLREEELAIMKEEIEARRQERERNASINRMSGEAEIQSTAYRNDFALKLMQLKDSIDYERVRTGGEAEINLAMLVNELEITSRKDAYNDSRFEAELRKRKLRDEYELDRKQSEQDLQNRQTTFEFDIARQAQADQLNRYKAISEIDAEEEDRAAKRRIAEENARREHERAMHAMDIETEREHNRLRAGMTAEQIAAEQLAQLDKEAQVAFMRAGKDIEQERELRRESNRMHEEAIRLETMRNNDMKQYMADMTQQMLNAMTTMSGHIVENRNEQRHEYRDELHREQARHDIHQDRALNYTTRQQVAPQSVVASPKQSNSQQMQMENSVHQQTNSLLTPKNAMPAESVKSCPQCNKQYPDTEMFCGDCGCELDS